MGGNQVALLICGGAMGRGSRGPVSVCGPTNQRTEDGGSDLKIIPEILRPFQ